VGDDVLRFLSRSGLVFSMSVGPEFLIVGGLRLGGMDDRQAVALHRCLVRPVLRRRDRSGGANRRTVRCGPILSR